MDKETYPVPPHGWTCFHCGETFLPTHEGHQAAKDHFSAVPTLPPECIDAASPARKLARRARTAEARRRSAEQDAQMGYDLLGAKQQELYAIRRKLGSKRDSNIVMDIDYLQGEVAAAKAVVEWIERRFPGVVAKARSQV